MNPLLIDNITLQSPAYLWAVLAIPLLWWLLRLIPPEAIRRRFPSLRLFENLPPLRAQTAYTPIWLLILRGVMVALIIIGFAEPVFFTHESSVPPPDQPVVMLMDNCWSAAPNFAAMRAEALSILENLPPEQNIAVIAACPADANAIISQGLISTPAARALIHHLKPRDDIADWAHVLEAMRNLELAPIAHVTVISSGVMNNADDRSRLLQELSTYDHVNIALPAESHLPVMLSATIENQKINVQVRRFTSAGTAIYQVVTRNPRNHILSVNDIKIPEGETSGSAVQPIPHEAISEVSTIAIPNMGMLAYTVWHAPSTPTRVGLVEQPTTAPPLLQPNHYLRAALRQSEIVESDWPALLGQNLPVVVQASPELPPEHLAEIRTWVQSGGTLVRFADTHLPSRTDDLMPAPPIQVLHHAPDQFLNAEPLGLAAFPAESPLHDLPITAAPKFYQHTLLDASDLTPLQIWASYDDATPMIASKPLGMGRSVFVTAPPTPLGGNWVLSGMFPHMLQKIIGRHADHSTITTTTAEAVRAQMDIDNLVILHEKDFPNQFGVMDLNTVAGQTALAPYAFILAALFWLADQALIVIRFAGLMQRRR